MNNQQTLRDKISYFMKSLPLPDDDPLDVIRVREDGVKEFAKHWRVRGNQNEGVYASYTDCGDVIEYGVLERRGDEAATNILHVTVLLEDQDVAEVNSISETKDELNFDTWLPHGKRIFDKTLTYFAENIGHSDD